MTSVKGKTYIERVIKGLSKINGAQFRCHFSPTKPFDKMEDLGYRIVPGQLYRIYY